MYPAGAVTYVIVEGMSERLCGKSRPGHFRGVATIVLKLINIVRPQLAWFGRKDAQQVAVLQQMVRDLNLDAEIVVCPLVREADGLAMSSRNTYLDLQQRKAALVLYRSLQEVKREFESGESNAAKLAEQVENCSLGSHRSVWIIGDR
jgi:pantoate--beta-alanine ligase